MRHRTYHNGGYSRGGVAEDGGEPSGPVMLFRDPETNKEATTKRYVDMVSSNVSALAFTRGELSPLVLPSFLGDVVKTDNDIEIRLNPTGVQPDTYTKLTVDISGRITQGGNLTPQDLPNLSWNKVKANSPTTVSGYGITDALTTQGGSFLGPLFIIAEPNGPNDIVTKKYVDDLTSTTTRPGDIILYIEEVTPENFLRCNGGVVSASLYPNLFSVIGTMYDDVGSITPGMFTLPERTSDLHGLTYYIKY